MDNLIDIRNLAIKSLIVFSSLDKAYYRPRNRIVSLASKTYSRSRNIFSLTNASFQFHSIFKFFTNLSSSTFSKISLRLIWYGSSRY